MSVTVIDKMPSFKRSVYNVMDDAVREAARDTLINAKTRAPFKAGALRSGTEVKRVSPLKHRVSFWMEYARFQEFGGDGKRRVRKYTHSGTGKGYLKKSGDEQAQKIRYTFAKHAQRARP